MTIKNSDFVPVSEVQHFLVKLMQECNELSHVVSKVLEFGVDSQDPVTLVTNMGAIQKEFNDIVGVTRTLNALGFPITIDEKLVELKVAKMEKFANDSRRIGMLSKERVVTTERISKVRVWLKDLQVKCERLSIKTDISSKHDILHLDTLCALRPELETYVNRAYDDLSRLLPHGTFAIQSEFDPELGTYLKFSVSVPRETMGDAYDRVIDYQVNTLGHNSYFLITIDHQ